MSVGVLVVVSVGVLVVVSVGVLVVVSGIVVGMVVMPANSRQVLNESTIWIFHPSSRCVAHW